MENKNMDNIVEWVKNNINIHNTQLPEKTLNMIQDSSPDNIPDEFLSFAIVVYAIKNNFYEENLSKDELLKLLSDKEASLYIFQLYFSFMLEKLRRLNIISFEPFNILTNVNIDALMISVSDKEQFIEEEVRGKTIPYKEFVNAVF